LQKYSFRKPIDDSILDREGEMYLFSMMVTCEKVTMDTFFSQYVRRAQQSVVDRRRGRPYVLGEGCCYKFANEEYCNSLKKRIIGMLHSKK
jgi:hypothetical protein